MAKPPKQRDELDSVAVGIRAHDMHHGLIRKQSGLINRFMKRTKIIGTAAQLCAVIKDFEVIEDYAQLEVSAGEIGIDGTLMEKSLREMEEMGFVRLKESGGEIRRVDITVPLLREVYEQLGEKWALGKPSDEERVSIEILDDVTLVPAKVRSIQRRYNLNGQEFQLIRDIGANAGYLGTYKSQQDGEEVLYSPLHWDEHPEDIERLASKYTSLEVVEALRKVRAHQGMPGEQVTEQVLKDAIRSGLLPAPSVESMRGRKSFLFTPGYELKPYEKSIVEKARAIIACVRYGEVYGTITKIRYPVLLLTRLRDRKWIGAHTEILRQYETLRNLGVGRICREGSTSKYSFHLIDNQENLKAIDLAIELLQIGEPIAPDEGVRAAKQLLLPGMYLNPTGTRARFTQVESMQYSSKTLEVVNDLIRGVSIEDL